MRVASKEIVVLKGTVKVQTQKALLFVPNEDHVDCENEEDYTKGIWFPFSQVSYIKENKEVQGEDEIRVSAWIAKTKAVHARS